MIDGKEYGKLFGAALDGIRTLIIGALVVLFLLGLFVGSVLL